MEKMSLKSKYIFDWKGALALIGGLVVATTILSLLNTFSIFVFKKNWQYTDFYLVLANAVAFLGAIFAFDYFIVRPQTGKKLNVNLSPTNVTTYFLVFPMMLGMMFIAEFIAAQIPISGPFFGEYYQYFSSLMEQMTKDKATMILLVVFIAPLLEEIVFRGIIQKGLINKGMKPVLAIIIASVVFGLVHGNPWQFVGAVLLGCVLGLVYHKTKSLLLPILLHAFNNFCSALLILYADTESFAETFKVSEWVVLGIGIILFGSFYYFFMKKYRVHYSEN